LQKASPNKNGEIFHGRLPCPDEYKVPYCAVSLDRSMNIFLIDPAGVTCGEGVMASADEYLAMSLDLLSRAECESDPEKRVKLEALAESYRRTAEQAKASALTIEIDLPSKEDGKAG
jgi:hypothetical protein